MGKFGSMGFEIILQAFWDIDIGDCSQRDYTGRVSFEKQMEFYKFTAKPIKYFSTIIYINMYELTFYLSHYRYISNAKAEIMNKL